MVDLVFKVLCIVFLEPHAMASVHGACDFISLISSALLARAVLGTSPPCDPCCHDQIRPSILSYKAGL